MRARARSSRVKAMVVEAACSPEPAGELGEGRRRGAGQRPAHRGDPRGAAGRRAPGAARSGSGARESRPAGGSRAGRRRRRAPTSGISSSRCSRSRSVAQLGHGHLLDLVGGVAALDPRAQRPPLDRLGQDHRGHAPVSRWRPGRRRRACGSRGRRGAGPRSSSSERCSTMLAQPGVGAEEVLADVGARLDVRSAGTRRRRSCSSCRAARRRRRGPAARPSPRPRSP